MARDSGAIHFLIAAAPQKAESQLSLRTMLASLNGHLRVPQSTVRNAEGELRAANKTVMNNNHEAQLQP
jgi:hypothetical protein